LRNPVELEIFKNLYHSIAEEMGAALRRSAFSPNIKERRDYSCAVFDAAGQVIAMGDHMPVHLGSMPMSVKAAIGRLEFHPGDVAMLNDPFCGGTHLPDITLVAPVYVGSTGSGKRTPDYYVASRAHHADVGGTFPGSMGLCREIYQEGFRIPPVMLVREGRTDADVLALLLTNVRTPAEREGDLRAQTAACHTGDIRIREVCARYGIKRAKTAAANILEYSEEMMRAFLEKAPKGTVAAEDFLDSDDRNGKPVRIAVSITFSGNRFRGKRGTATRSARPLITIDFAGTDPQVESSINAVEAITYSACFYVLRCLLAEDVPATAGLMAPVRVLAPKGSVVNAQAPAAVAGGNVETSQRIVDVLMRALAQAFPQRIPAAASGTMNNLTIGGMDPATNEPFAYYETIAGGMGGRPTKPGVSGVHTHMTNSLNTPAEALEYAYPLRVRRYAIRSGSGGAGSYRGGDGLVREIEVLADCHVTLLADRRNSRPFGLAGGQPGKAGIASVLRRDGSIEKLSGRFSLHLKKGDRVCVESPGGGGFGVEHQAREKVKELTTTK
jgi:N-methylhydantoinase B